MNNLMRIRKIINRFGKGSVFFIIITIIILCYQNAYAQYPGRNTTVIDTPTAFTLERGMYQFSFLGYDNGGVELMAFIGLHDNLYLGASFDMQAAVGKDEPEPHAPGVIAKIKFTDGWERFPISVAIGYDSFYIGQEGRTYNSENVMNRMIYGPFFVVTKPVYVLDEEQHIHFGIRVPVQPYYVPEDTSYFLSLDIPFGDTFMLKAEGERIYYDLSRPREWMLNLGIRYTYLYSLSVEFAFLIQKKERANRVLRIEYNGEF
jgi:hypothetical protein